ncbi:hypothetical protein [Georgenia sp. H159]|uniref:hypothetical protein n=1 Tax=Georgenia sp. H159 TaxID=3076115 RepID=UPI002D773A89|nr:hypothetical protein [Georgenia sp. H159]
MARPHRLLQAAAVIGASTLVAGCSFMTPIQTTEPYAPGDGVRVEISDDVRVENLMVLADEEGAEGQVFGALVNDSVEEVAMSVTIGDGGIQMSLEPGQTVLLGPEEVVVIPTTPVPPGAMAEALIETAGYGTVSAPVPVLGDALPPYAPYVP